MIKEFAVNGNKDAARAQAHLEFFQGGLTNHTLKLDSEGSDMAVIVRNKENQVVAIYWHD